MNARELIKALQHTIKNKPIKDYCSRCNIKWKNHRSVMGINLDIGLVVDIFVEETANIEDVITSTKKKLQIKYALQPYHCGV